MEGCFNNLLKILAGICAALFVITMGIALLAYNVEWRLFNPELYLRVFESQNLYERVPALAAEGLVASANFDPCADNPIACGGESRETDAHACFESALGAQTYESLLRNERVPTEAELASAQPCFDQFGRPEPNEGGIPDYMKTIPAEDWQAIIRAVLPPDMLERLVEDTFHSIFGYLNGETDSATLSMTAFKSHLSGPSGFEAVMQLLSSQPACTPDEIEKMETGDLSGTKHLILCNPADESLDVVEPVIREELQFLAERIPDEAVLIPAGAEGAQNPMTALRVARGILRLSPILPLGLLFLISVFAVRSLKGWMYWWGIPLFLSGLFGLALAAAVHPIFLWAFRAYLEPNFSRAIPASFVETSRDLMNAVLAGVAAPIAFQSIALLLIGIVMVLSTRFKKKPAPLLDAEERS